MFMASSRKVMGPLVIPQYLKVVGWLATAVMLCVDRRVFHMEIKSPPDDNWRYSVVISYLVPCFPAALTRLLDRKGIVSAREG